LLGQQRDTQFGRATVSESVSKIGWGTATRQNSVILR